MVAGCTCCSFRDILQMPDIGPFIEDSCRELEYVRSVTYLVNNEQGIVGLPQNTLKREVI